MVDLSSAADKKIGAYSKGMRQRVKLAQALVHSPELIFLDEPTNGLDPDGRRRMLDLVLRVHAELGTGVILASHLLGDVERVADQLVRSRRPAPWRVCGRPSRSAWSCASWIP